MEIGDQLECPTDGVKINEYKVRWVAFQVWLFSIWLIAFPSWLPALILLYDFTMRTLALPGWSILSWIAEGFMYIFGTGSKPVDRAPKRFAAGVGLFFSASILTLVLLEFTTAAWVLSSVLFVFSALESFVGFCAGCYVYSFLKKLGSRYGAINTTIRL